MTSSCDLHKTWSEDRAYREEFDVLDEAYVIAEATIEARRKAGLGQASLARLMKTRRSVIRRVEGGRVRPSAKMLARIEEATGFRPDLDLEALKKMDKRS